MPLVVVVSTSTQNAFAFGIFAHTLVDIYIAYMQYAILFLLLSHIVCSKCVHLIIIGEFGAEFVLTQQTIATKIIFLYSICVLTNTYLIDMLSIRNSNFVHFFVCEMHTIPMQAWIVRIFAVFASTIQYVPLGYKQKQTVRYI